MGDEAIVVTGLGCLSPCGNTAKDTFEAVCRGKSGIGRVPFADNPEWPVSIAGLVKSYDPAKFMGKKESRRHARFTQLAAGAAHEATQDAGYSAADFERTRVASILGVGFGGIEVIEEQVANLSARGPNRVSPFGLPACIANIAPGYISIAYGTQGPSFAVASACASAGHAIGICLALLRAGVVDVAITGGAEACVSPISLASFARMTALSRRNDRPEAASRPFDRDRDGFVMAEGAAVLVLERRASAARRGAKIYAEVAGSAASADAHHITEPGRAGLAAAQCMINALRDARVAPEDVSHVNAHGSGTPANDEAETRAIRHAFGDHADRLWVSGTKSMTGHMLGAAGGIEAVLTVLAIHNGVVPPTINLDNPDPACDLDYVSDGARERVIDVALSNSFGFGGQNACLVFRRAT